MQSIFMIAFLVAMKGREGSGGEEEKGHKEQEDCSIKEKEDCIIKEKEDCIIKEKDLEEWTKRKAMIH